MTPYIEKMVQDEANNLKQAVLKDDDTGDIGMLYENWVSLAKHVLKERLLARIQETHRYLDTLSNRDYYDKRMNELQSQLEELEKI